MELHVLHAIEICESYIRYKIQKVIENSVHDDETKLSSYKSKPNPLVLIECALFCHDEVFINLVLDQLLNKIRVCHLNENSLSQISFDTMKILLSADEILIDEMDLIEYFQKWKMVSDGSVAKSKAKIGSDWASIPELKSLPESSDEYDKILNRSTDDISNLLRYYLLDADELDILKTTEAISEKELKMTMYLKSRATDFKDIGLKRRQGSKIRPHFAELGIK